MALHSKAHGGPINLTDEDTGKPSAPTGTTRTIWILIGFLQNHGSLHVRPERADDLTAQPASQRAGAQDDPNLGPMVQSESIGSPQFLALDRKRGSMRKLGNLPVILGLLPMFCFASGMSPVCAYSTSKTKTIFNAKYRIDEAYIKRPIWSLWVRRSKMPGTARHNLLKLSRL